MCRQGCFAKLGVHTREAVAVAVAVTTTTVVTFKSASRRRSLEREPLMPELTSPRRAPPADRSSCPLGQPCHLAVEGFALVVGGHSGLEAEGAFGG